jgi:hypothetical protein
MIIPIMAPIPPNIFPATETGASDNITKIALALNYFEVRISFY